MIRRLIEAVARRLPQPRVIYDIDGTSPYLSRYYLIGRPSMPDGSEPFDQYGNPKRGVEWARGGIGIYLHRFHRDDKDRELHNHPWLWSCSLILAGGYTEERRAGDRVVTRTLRPGRLNWIGHEDYHRVDLLEDEAWSLFVVGPKVSSWGFWERVSGGFTPWREFVEARQRGEARRHDVAPKRLSVTDHEGRPLL